MTDPVYCEDCKWHIKYLWMHYCDSPKVFLATPMRKEPYYVKCREKNKDNDCKDFEGRDA